MTDFSLRNTFGPLCYNKPKGQLAGMIDAGSLEQCEETLSSSKKHATLNAGEKTEKLKQISLTFQETEIVMPHTVFVQHLEIIFVMDQLQRK